MVYNGNRSMSSRGSADAAVGGQVCNWCLRHVVSVQPCPSNSTATGTYSVPLWCVSDSQLARLMEGFLSFCCRRTQKGFPRSAASLRKPRARNGWRACGEAMARLLGAGLC